ncbi:MAG: Helicase associated domain protein [Lachnospiraceae bacterium]|nr:Helicase associated domain protein [Lachnospiraceae bacterium]
MLARRRECLFREEEVPDIGVTRGWEVRTLEVVLYEHNMSAYNAAVDMMKRTGKAAIIHPTGTGKSFIGFRLCADLMETDPRSPLTAAGVGIPEKASEEVFENAFEKASCAAGFAGKRVLWLSPSEYIFKTQLENLKAANGGEVPANIIFCTYAKLMWMSDEEIAEICPAYIILDEFHRCGAQMWGQGVQKLLSIFPDTPILGLSATNIRYLDNQRDMAEELFDGNIASEMTLGEAIVRGILNPPKYVLSVYSCQQSFEKYERRVRNTKNKAVRDTCEQYLEELKRALEMSEGLDEIFDRHMTDRTGKYIVFCSNKEHMDEMMGHLEWFSKVDQHPHVYSLYTSDPGSDQAFDDFRADNDETHLRLLYCIDALNEGIHVEGISGVILLRPTVSPIIYKQQIGRALSAGKSRDAVVFDIVQNLNCLESWAMIEDEMQLVTSYYRDLRENSSIVNEHFRIIDEVKDCRELFRKLDDTLSASWDLMFDLARAYYEEHGSLEMQAAYVTEEGYPLGQWVFTQRGARKGTAHGCLTEERIRKLDSIGMVWDSSLDRLWEKNYSAAKAYYEAHGNLDVKWDYVTEDGICLGEWLCSIRTYEKAGARQKYLTEERVKLLNDIGMIWGKTDYFWERNYAAAADYYKAHGNLDVPAAYVSADGIKLGNWICWLRKERKKSGSETLPRKEKQPTEEQIRRLDAIGMLWTVNDTKWNIGYQAAKEYAAAHGSLLVPARYVTEDGFRLGSWISNQRFRFLKGQLSASRVEKLNAIGMVWQADPWEYRLELVKNWYRDNGTLAIPQNTVEDGVWIGKWLISQKKALEEGKLSRRQAELLSELPLETMTKISASWQQMYQDAKEYIREFGSLGKVPEDYRGRSGKKLKEWIRNQRRAMRTGRLSEEKIQMLDAIRFDWRDAKQAASEKEGSVPDICLRAV